MSCYLFPRLDRFAVDGCLASPEAIMDPIKANLAPGAMPSGTTFAASGGTPVSAEILINFRTAAIEAASEAGFPKPGGTKNRAKFDELMSVFLVQQPLLFSGEALRDDVWAFIATVVLPDLATWRFPDRPAERFHGGIRNVFQRLWMRALVLDRGEQADDRWGLLTALSEDAMVQITERPSIGADPALARAFAEGWWRASEARGRAGMEELTRKAVIRLRLRNQIQMLSMLDEPELAKVIDEFFVIETMAVEAKTPTARTGWIGRVLRGSKSELANAG